jgi:hypothetical protein
MANKLPKVGHKYCVRKQYLNNNDNKTTRENKIVTVTEIEKQDKDFLIHYKYDDGTTNCLSSIVFLNFYYEPTNDSNQANFVDANKKEPKLPWKDVSELPEKLKQFLTKK